MQQVRKTRSTRIALRAGRKAENSVHAWGSVAGHRARTGTARRASSALHIEKRCARGKVRRRARRRPTVWMERRAHTWKGEAPVLRGRRGRVIMSTQSLMASVDTQRIGQKRYQSRTFESVLCRPLVGNRIWPGRPTYWSRPLDSIQKKLQ